MKLLVVTLLLAATVASSSADWWATDGEQTAGTAPEIKIDVVTPQGQDPGQAEPLIEADPWTVAPTPAATKPAIVTTAPASCPKTPDALLLVKQCRFFSEIMGVQPNKGQTGIYPPRSLIVAVTVFCKVPDAESTFVSCVEETFRSTTCSTQVQNQLSQLSTEYWKRYCLNVDDNIQTLKYLFTKIPVHLVDEQWEVGSNEVMNMTDVCVKGDELQDLVINPCARWYNRVIGSGSRERPLDVYVDVASRSSDIGLQCVKRRMLRSTTCSSDLIYLMLRALYVFQGLPGVSIPLVYLDPSFARQNPQPSTECAPRTTVGIWGNQFVLSANRGVRYCPLTSGAVDLLTTDTIEMVGILNMDQGVTSIDIRFYNTDQHDPIVWYKASEGKLPTTFTSAVTQQSTISIQAIHTPSIPTDTKVVKITDTGVGQMAIYVSVRNGMFYDIMMTGTDFEFSYATGILIHSCSKKEDIDYKTEVVNLQQTNVTSAYADECQDACRDIVTVGFHDCCLIGCMRRGGDSRIVNTINMLLGFKESLKNVCKLTMAASPRTLAGVGSTVVPPSFFVSLLYVLVLTWLFY